MSESTKIKYDSGGKIKEASIKRANANGSTTATYKYDGRGIPHLQRTEQKRK